MKKETIKRNNCEIDPETGEVIKELPPPMHKGHFVKFFPKLFIPVISNLTGKQGQVLSYILEFMKASDNTFSSSYKQIEKDLNLSHQTVVTAMKVFKKLDFIRSKSYSEIMINPNMVIKGNDHKREELHKKYYEIK